MLAILIIIGLSIISYVYNKFNVPQRRELTGLLLLVQLPFTVAASFELFSKTMQHKGEVYFCILVWVGICIHLAWGNIKDANR